jgi:hypothetical protein
LSCLKLGSVFRVLSEPIVVRATVDAGHLCGFGDLAGYRVGL